VLEAREFCERLDALEQLRSRSTWFNLSVSGTAQDYGFGPLHVQLVVPYAYSTAAWRRMLYPCPLCISFGGLPAHPAACCRLGTCQIVQAAAAAGDRSNLPVCAWLAHALMGAIVGADHCLSRPRMHCTCGCVGWLHTDLPTAFPAAVRFCSVEDRPLMQSTQCAQTRHTFGRR
jgi:hypothetical protein